MALRAAVYLAALGPQGLRETAELCFAKAHYAADQLSKIGGIKLRFDRPFFKELTIAIEKDVPAQLSRLVADGFHAGIHLGRWYPELNECISVAVTERRTRKEIDSLVSAYRAVTNRA
jgi:glycine dehydrogenase subunit 1